MFDTPILYLIFNRPDLTQITFPSICNIKPKKLFIAADGPRTDNKDDELNCMIARQYVLSKIDWDCEVRTLFRTINLGCGLAVSEGISWFFEQVEEGIILEDDILVEESFFYFASELLVRYRNNLRVTSITAANLMANKMELFSASYTYTNYGGIWGWASWRRAWYGYDYKINNWNRISTRFQFIKRFGLSQTLFFHSVFQKISISKEINTWDYQWWFHQLQQNGLSVTPRTNLMQNIGFGPQATHTSNYIDAKLIVPIVPMDFPLFYPEAVATNRNFEFLIAHKFYSVNYAILKKIKLLKQYIFE
jgi:hypothetical protein